MIVLALFITVIFFFFCENVIYHCSDVAIDEKWMDHE